MKYQSRGLASLNDAAPLFPLHRLTFHHSVKGSPIGFHIGPLLRLAKDNFLLLFEDPRGPELVEALLHVFNGLVIDLKQAVDCRMFDIVQKQHEHGSLCGQRCAARASAFHKDGASMVRIDALQALPVVASVLGDASVRL